MRKILLCGGPCGDMVRPAPWVPPQEYSLPFVVMPANTPDDNGQFAPEYRMAIYEFKEAVNGVLRYEFSRVEVVIAGNT